MKFCHLWKKDGAGDHLLREVSQTQKDRLHILPLKCRILLKQHGEHKREVIWQEGDQWERVIRESQVCYARA